MPKANLQHFSEKDFIPKKVGSTVRCSFKDNTTDAYYSPFNSSEVVIGLTATVGTNLTQVVKILKELFEEFAYQAYEIKISRDIIDKLPIKYRKQIERRKKGEAKIVDCFYEEKETEYRRYFRLMSWGDTFCEETNDKGILGYAAAGVIAKQRTYSERCSWIISSLKRPEEVMALKRIYNGGFYLIGAYSDEGKRFSYLKNKGMSCEEASALIERDQKDRQNNFGQSTYETFALSDYFINADWGYHSIKKALERFIHLLFGNPYLTPTFDEYAMFSAFGSSLLSLDLGRTVGAIIANPHNEILAMGYNDVPKFGGGLYETLQDRGEYLETKAGRDFTVGRNQSKQYCEYKIQQLQNQQLRKEEVFHEKTAEICLKDNIEYMRAVHAEMEAILGCARKGISTRGCTLYVTTFPCHECAKNIIAAGIERVVFIEPYPKSLTLHFHKETTKLGLSRNDGKLNFEPYVGVGPRRFFDLFSMHLGSGYPTRRQDDNGYVIPFKPREAYLRTPLYPVSYQDREQYAKQYFDAKLIEDP